MKGSLLVGFILKIVSKKDYWKDTSIQLLCVCDTKRAREEERTLELRLLNDILFFLPYLLLLLYRLTAHRAHNLE